MLNLRTSKTMSKTKCGNQLERSHNRLVARIADRDHRGLRRHDKARAEKRPLALHARKVLVVQPGQTAANVVGQLGRQAGKPVRQLEKAHRLVVSENPQEGQILVGRLRGLHELVRDSAVPRWVAAKQAPRQAGPNRLAPERAVPERALEERKRKAPAVDPSVHPKVSEVVAKADHQANVNATQMAL